MRNELHFREERKEREKERSELRDEKGKEGWDSTVLQQGLGREGGWNSQESQDGGKVGRRDLLGVRTAAICEKKGFWRGWRLVVRAHEGVYLIWGYFAVQGGNHGCMISYCTVEGHSAFRP